MDWVAFAFKLPQIIQGAVAVVDHIKGAKGADKKQAVLDSIPAGVALTDYAAGRDILNDAAIATLVSVYVDAEAAVLKARNALKAGILAKQPPAPVVP